MVTTLFDVILKCILIASGVMFLIMTLALCIAVIRVALEDRRNKHE